jgi:Ca2+:H+ antiporter
MRTTLSCGVPAAGRATRGQAIGATSRNVRDVRRARVPAPFRQLSIGWLLLLAPLSILAAALGRWPLATFLLAGGTLPPLADVLGTATQQIGLHAGPHVGGLLNATFANLTEFILAIVLVLYGEVDVVKTALTGSILGNLLLVLGFALLAGGVRHRMQRYSAAAAGVHATSLALAVIGLLMPALFFFTAGRPSAAQGETVSVAVAAVLIVLYGAALVFTLRTHEHLFRTPVSEERPEAPLGWAIGVLAAASVVVAVEAELLVSTLEPAIGSLGLSKFFTGLVLIPLFGNVAEHSAAVRFALRNQLDTTLEIAIGSSTQVALFVAPALVLISLAVGHPMDFIFTTFEVAAVGLAVLIVTFISHDGRSNWLEGAQLLAAYAIMAASAFFVTSL